MTQLTRPDLHAGIEQSFPDNELARITPLVVRAFLHGLVDSALLPASDAEATPNVPLWSATQRYTVGFVVLYSVSGPRFFYEAKRVGLLPAPTPGEEDGNWRPAAPPVPPTALYFNLDLGYASYLASRYPDSVKRGLLYPITGDWNAAGDATQVVSVLGVAGGFAQAGMLLRNGVLSAVTVDVAAGTAVPAASSQANPYVEITTAPGYRFAEIPVLPGFDIVAEVLDENAYVLLYQLDLNTRTSSRVFGTPGITLAQLRPALKVLTPAQYTAGVRLTVQTVATSPPDTARIGLDTRLNRALALAPGTRAGFPTDPGAPVSLTINGHFLDPFVEDETKGWRSSGGWVWDNLNLSALAPAGANSGNSNGLFLYQVCGGFVNSASYYASLLLADLPDGTPVTGSLVLHANGQDIRVGTAPLAAGRYFVPFTANALTFPISINPLGGGTFTGAIKEFDIFRS